jgi:hypothetical protein
VTSLTDSLLLPDTPLVLVPAVAVQVPVQEYDAIMDTYLSQLLGCSSGRGGLLEGPPLNQHEESNLEITQQVHDYIHITAGA